MLADARGRGQASRANPIHSGLEKNSEKLEVTAAPPKPLVQGKQLLGMGYPPGKEMGRLLTKVYGSKLSNWSQRQSALAWLLEAYPPPQEASS